MSHSASGPLLDWTISDSAMLSAAMRSGAVASRQKEHRRRATTRARRLLLPDTTRHDVIGLMPARERKRVSTRSRRVPSYSPISGLRVYRTCSIDRDGKEERRPPTPLSSRNDEPGDPSSGRVPARLRLWLTAQAAVMSSRARCLTEAPSNERCTWLLRDVYRRP
jgi:hypothetical protein